MAYAKTTGICQHINSDLRGVLLHLLLCLFIHGVTLLHGRILRLLSDLALLLALAHLLCCSQVGLELLQAILQRLKVLDEATSHSIYGAAM